MATVIPAIGEPRELAPAKGDAFTLEELQQEVGGYIEAVRMDEGRVMFVNEEGKLKDLPLNYVATTLVKVMSAANGGTFDDVIVGNVIVCTRVEAGEDDET